MAESILDGFSTHAERQLVMSDRFNDMLSALQSTGIDLMQQIDEQASRRATDVISAMGDGLQRIKLQFSSEVMGASQFHAHTDDSLVFGRVESDIGSGM